MVRVYTGPQWQPAEIGVMTDNIPCDYIREYFPRTRLRLSQAYTYIALDKALLSLPPPSGEAMVQTSSRPHYDTITNDFVNSLEQILTSYVQESDLSIELAAALCNKSKRTLQRTLKETGTCYSEVLGHAQFRVASRMLQNPGMKVTDIAKRLGYSDVAHLARAFRRIAGITPRAYRQQFTH
jgi:AraC-like DNA-binding protein